MCVVSSELEVVGRRFDMEKVFGEAVHGYLTHRLEGCGLYEAERSKVYWECWERVRGVIGEVVDEAVERVAERKGGAK